ncbi:hypothetical protein FPZ42_06550 [Mucilaginibacter achroorhodeus]|uniref:Uncharacterized protein n=1 Tax=Mucilaginibacter achroorhodeus TaxID=2599294 RepID=A0A563U5V3_9SPHI|nr:hypothetical protein [Mucilaginibacter achroorhodeus]TWR26694.1 hypothetical protein FPZ42_06550 [Mucilaginibacter achroorhodeus]
MKKQLFYRSPDINGNGGGDDEQPVNETSTDSGEETSSEEGATDGDATLGEETTSEDGATDEDVTSDEETGSEDGATDEHNTELADENTSEDGATDGNNTEEGETSTNEEETPEDGNTEEGETSTNEEETPDDGNTEDGETSTNEEETPEEGNAEEGETSTNEEETPEEGNTEEGETSTNEEETPEEGNAEEEQTPSSEEQPEESNNEEKEPLVEDEFPKNNNGGGQQSSNEAEAPKENNLVSAPPVAVAWPGNLSQSHVSSPGDELAAFITAIKANRANVPEHLTDKNKVKNGYMYDPFSGKSQPQPASIQPNTVDAWIWEELRSEGSYTSINTYDNMVVTWGRGVAGANIAKVLKSVFSAHSDIQTEFNNVGIALNTNGILQVVDTTQNCVKEASFALQTIKADKKLLDFLVDISLNDKYKEVFLDAQWSFVKTFNSTLFAHVNASSWSKDAVQLMFHFNWWLPAYAWNGHPQNYKDTGGDVNKIIYIFAGNLNKNAVLVGYLKKFAGNAFSKYVAKQEYETQPSGEHIVFEDAGKTYYFPKL